MRIALITPLFSSHLEKECGIGVHYRDLALGLRDGGHSVEVFHFPYDTTESKEYTFENIPVHCVGLPHPVLPKLKGLGKLLRTFNYFDFFEAFQLFQITKRVWKAAHLKKNFHIIEATSNRGVAYGLSTIKNRPPIFTRVSTTMKQAFESYPKLPDLNYRLAARFEEHQIKMSDYLVTHTQNHANSVAELLSFNPARFEIIPHSIRREEPEVSPISNKTDMVRILFVGRLEERKGFDVLIKSIPIIMDKSPNVVVHICGEGDLLQFAKTKLNCFNKRVFFHGYQSRASLNNFYSECDIFVAPSRYESFGLIYLEAMHFGKAIVACNSGGTPEVVKDHETGILVKPEDHLELANSILKLVENSDLRKKLGSAGKSRLKELFSLDRMIQSTVNHYCKALNPLN
ncbi:glycosyltransferase family 4 protein [Opitutales bacterium]|nr:glycosyltransferase family 4 protein [Opitutales bacterium]